MLETTEQKHLYEADTIALPSINVVLGEVPSPDPVKRFKSRMYSKPHNPEMVKIVRRIIDYLETQK